MSDKDLSELFNRNLEKYLQRKNMSLSDLAGAIGVKKSTISMWRNGTNMPRAATLEKIADILDISPSALYEDIETTMDVVSKGWKDGHIKIVKNDDVHRTIYVDSEPDTSHPFYILQEKVKRGEQLSDDEKEKWDRYTKEALDSTLKAFDKFGETISECFQQLNEAGQAEAVKRVQELTEIPRYRKDTEQ